MSVTVKSYAQILGDMLRKFAAKTGVSDFHPGSAVLSFFESASASDYEQISSLIQLLDDFSVDNATGPELIAIAIERGLTDAPRPSTNATGYVDFGDDNFTKVSTNLYVGVNPPIAGDLVLRVNALEGIAATDQVYVGRNTLNEEGPFTVASVTAGVAFSTITLATPLANNHSPNETVVLAQGGDRSIPTGTKVSIPASNAAPATSFTTQVDAVILDGEDTVQNILVRADRSGTTGNAPLRSITEFDSSPFSGATVTNTTAFRDAQDAESDDQLRDRIKDHIQSLSKGVPAAIRSAIIGLFDSEDNKRVISANLVQPTEVGDIGRLYIDDGTGFEPSFSGRGEEVLIEDAAGTEKFFQVGNYPITRAQVTTTTTQPYDFSTSATLSVKVNGIREEIALNPSDFEVPDSVTAIEVAEAINSKTDVISARTANGLTNVVIFPAALEDETIEVVPGGANDVLNFPTDEIHTLKLYKNNVLLAKDGLTARTESSDIDTWSAPTDPSFITVDANDKPRLWIRVGTASLAVSFDGVTYVTLSDVDTFLDLGVTITTASVAQWVTVLNQAVNGATFSVDGDRLVLTSDTEFSDESEVQVVSVADGGGNLATAQGWDTEAKVGKTSEYALNRFSGQIELVTPLVEGDELSAGTSNTRGQVTSEDSVSGVFDLSAGAGSRPAAIYVVVDSEAIVRNVPLQIGVTTITTSNPGGNVWRYTDTSANAATDKVFEFVEVGDYVVIARQSSANEGIFRVIDRTDVRIDVENPNGGVAVFTILEAVDIQAFYSNIPPQKVTFVDSSSTTPTSVVTQINEQIVGATAEVDGDAVTITANWYDVEGSVQVPVSVEWVSGSRLDFSDEFFEGQESHIAAIESESELGFPVAVAKGSITTNDATNPFTTLTDTARSAGTPTPSSKSTPNQWVKYLDRTGTDFLPNTNRSIRSFVQVQSSGTPTVLTLRDSSYTALGSARLVVPDVLAPLVVGDTYQQFYPYDFASDDNLVVIVDDDEVGGTFNIPMARSGRVTLAGASSISGIDTDAPTTTTFADAVWNTFDFADYKVWFRAHKVVDPTGTKNAIIHRSVKYGPTGNRLRIGYDYPTETGADTESSVSTTAGASNVTVDVLVTLGSGAARAIASDSTTQFDITAAGTSVTYTYDGTGTAPAFVANGVVVGDIATFSSPNFDPANNGTYLITAVAATSITVLNNKTTPVVESNKTLGTNDGLIIYPLASNAASDVVSAVNDGDASSLVMESILTTSDPFGTTNDGTGTIVRSTLDDVAIADDYLTLVDGENWVDTFASPGPPSFTLKKAITELTVVGGAGNIYDFSSAPNTDATTGELFKLIPVHAKNVKDHFTKNAITALSLVASVARTDNAQRIQIASQNIGSEGSVFVTGGNANGVTASVDKVAGTESVWTRLTIPTSSLGFHSDQVVKLANQFVTKEVNTFDAVTVATTTVPGGTNPYRRVTLGDRASLNVGASTFSVTANVDGTATYTRTAGAADLSPCIAGDELVVSTSFNVANRGAFLVVSSTTTTVIVINPEAFAEAGVTPAAADMVCKTPFFYHPNLKSGDSTPNPQEIVVEKLNERFARYRYIGGATIAPLFSTRGVVTGHWVDVVNGTSAGFASANVGRFRVVAVDTTSFIVENENAVDDGPVELVDDPIGTGDFLGEVTTVLSGAGGNLQFWGPNSAMSDDVLAIELLSDPSWFPSPWAGRWDVVGHGRDDTNGKHFVYVDNSATTLAVSITLGTNVSSFLVLEGTPFDSYRIVEVSTPDPMDSEDTLVWVSGTTDSDRFSAANGTQIIAENKFAFPPTEQEGVDGYKYWTGLLRRVHRVMDGYDQDPINYPGVKAAGVQIEALPPEIRRVQISVNVRTVAGLSINSISQSIKSAILAYINSLGVGEDVVMSEVISRVHTVSGVQSVLLLDPSPDTEEIVIQDNEKAIAFESDLTVT